MSAEFEAAQEICAVLNAIDQNLDRIYKDMSSQRERIATAAMQGLLTHAFLAKAMERTSRADRLAACATEAVAHADALIVALNKPQTGE